MNNNIELEYRRPPMVLGALAKMVALPRQGYSENHPFPKITADWKSASVDRRHLQKYMNVCNLTPSEALPFLYPHVLASGMQLNLIAHKAFPIKMVGSVHLRNRVLQHRSIGVGEIFDIRCELSGQRLTENGIEVDVTTRLHSEGQLIWEGVSTYFTRGRNDVVAGATGMSDSKRSPQSAELPEMTQEHTVADWKIAANLGKRYARLTGDFNPIHISSTMAKLFGFKRDLIHGFCILATTFEHLPGFSKNRPVKLDVIFKGPVYMSHPVVLKQQRLAESSDAVEQRFNLYCGDNPRPSICGILESFPTGA